MPYYIRKRSKAKRPYAIIRKTDGKAVGTSLSLQDAKASIRARLANEGK